MEDGLFLKTGHAVDARYTGRISLPTTGFPASDVIMAILSLLHVHAPIHFQEVKSHRASKEGVKRPDAVPRENTSTVHGLQSPAS